MTLEIDRDFLGTALTDGGGMDCYLDRETGDILTDDDFGSEWNEDRYIKVDPLPSSEGYDFRVAFASSVEEPQLRVKLEHALQGKRGVFRRFLDIVRDHPQLEACWFAAEAKWLDERVSEWLEENGFPAMPDAKGLKPHGHEPFAAPHAGQAPVAGSPEVQ